MAYSIPVFGSWDRELVSVKVPDILDSWCHIVYDLFPTDLCDVVVHDIV